jgi:predicted SAM-dependent methyltransferase
MMQLKQIARSLYFRANAFYLSFGSGKECPICQWKGRAFIGRSNPNKPAKYFLCPSCGSSERHRFAYYVLKDRLQNSGNCTLHFAPEKCIEPWLRSISTEYLSVDIESPLAMQHMDINDLQIFNERYSLLWCSHVLEHIENDRKAMSELFRVLKPSGLAVIMVPIYGKDSYENPAIKLPGERLKHFYQEDHVRLYGLDIQNRLEKSGFQVEVIKTSDLPTDIINKYVLDFPSTNEIFLCSKP